MKFYNPFKWHIRQVGNKYVVAKRGILFWYFIDKDDFFDWSNASSFWRIHCLIDSKEKAKYLLQQVKQQGFVE